YDCCIIPNRGVVPITLSSMLSIDRVTTVMHHDLPTLRAAMHGGESYGYIFVDIDVLGALSDVRVELARLRCNFPEVAVIALSSRMKDTFLPRAQDDYDVALQIPVSEASLDLAMLQARINRELRINLRKPETQCRARSARAIG
ncbi:hypothetical protein SAMN05877809_1011, partial [Rhodobacter sp. JA431]|uniref:hypothetical protein n=1 Tax=Rhodobacter sp. JA431 TaxID=570013 RepID=UPI000BC5B5D4